jgi:hypothetical protein
LAKNNPRLSADDELYLDVMLNDRLVRKGIVAYMGQQPGQYWLPLTEVVGAADFQVSIDPAAGLAEGWITNEDDTFELNTETQKIVLRGEELTYTSETIQRQTDEIYVLATQLEAWLPLRFALDVNELRLAIVSTVKLAHEEQAARTAAWASLSRAKELERQALVKEAYTIPRQTFSAPQIDLNAQSSLNRSAGGDTHLGVGLNAQATAEALYGTGLATIGLERNSQNKIKLTDSTLAWRRQELTPNLLGPLKATSVAAGDIDFVATPLLGVTTQGRGVRVNNLPFNYVPDPDQFVLRGDAPVGWDVEVYQNQTLLAFARIESDGRYAFNALPLKVGLNVFRVVTYGPEGQKREQTQRFYLGEGQTAQGEWLYDTSLLQPNRKVIETTETPTRDGPDAILHNRFVYGLSNKTTASLGTFAALGDGGSVVSESGVSGGLRSSFGSLYGAMDIGRLWNGATSFATSVRGNLGYATDFRLGYDTQTTGTEDEGLRRQTFQADVGYMERWGTIGLDQNFGYRRTTAKQESTEQVLSHRVGIGVGRVSLNNTLDYKWRPQSDRLNGALDTTMHLAENPLQLGLVYEPKASQPLQKARATFKLPLTDTLDLDNVLQHTLTPATATTLESTLRYDMGPYVIGLRGSGDDQGNIGMGLTLSTHLMPKGKKLFGGYEAVHPSVGSSLASVELRVFTDTNTNGQYDPTDKAAVGVELRNLSRGTTHKTDKRGITRIDNIPPYTPVRFEIEEETLPDILVRYSGKPLVVIGHPGAEGTIDVPLQQFGELSGYAQQITPGGALPAGGIALEVVDRAGRIIDYTTTDSDGYFVLAPLPLGAFTLRSQPAAQGVTALEVTPQEVVLTGAEPIQSEITLSVKANTLPPSLGDEPLQKQGKTVVHN